VSLDVTKLQSNLENLRPVGNSAQAASAFTDAYVDYCADAITPAGGGLGPISVEPGRAVVLAQLTTVFGQNPNTANPATTAQGIAAALAAFWPAIQFKFSAPAVGPGIPAPPLNTPILAAFLSAMAPLPDKSALAALAAAIDTCVKTVVVTFPGPVSPIPSPVV
jgi:hypothetical protein